MYCDVVSLSLISLILFILDSKQIISIDKDPVNGLIVFASIVDPYILLLYDTGIVELMKIDDVTKEINSCELPSHINVILKIIYTFLKKSNIFPIVIYRNFQ